MDPDESYPHHSIDEQPKDLTIKTAKKMKPIPPPLNLHASEDSGNVPIMLLKEFANFATSPKSPLMQKHLPFRKRSHIVSTHVTADNKEEYDDTHNQQAGKYDQKADVLQSNLQQNSVTSSCSIDSLLNPITPNNQNVSLRKCEDSSQKNVQHTYVKHPQHVQSGTAKSRSSNALQDKDDPSQNEGGYVLDLSTHQNSVLLSPAPSSLGSSREELTSDSARVSPLYQTRLWGLPWPPPVWHCFQSDTKLKVGSAWCPVEEMSTPPSEWPAELRVEHMSLNESVVIISFSSPHMHTSLLVEVNRAHAFLVKDRGWTAVCGETLFSKYTVRCPSLQLGDIVMLPTIHRLPLPLPLPSPDICERIKRFSFPPPDESHSPHLLSPPTTPTRKNTDCDKPKRPMNAFMLFAKRFRLELIQSHPGKDNRAISVILGEVWRTLPQEEREIYIRGARDLSEEQKLLHPDCWKRKRSHSTS